MDLIEFNIKIMWKIKNIGKKHNQKKWFFPPCVEFSLKVYWDPQLRLIETLNQMFQLIPNQQANNLSYKTPANPKLL